MPQVEQTTDVERVVVGPRDLAHGVVFQLGVRVARVPPALLESEFVVHVVQGDVGIGAANEVVDIGVGQAGRGRSRFGLPATDGEEKDYEQSERNA